MDKDNKIGFVRLVTKHNSIIYYPVREVEGVKSPISVDEFSKLVELSKLHIPFADTGISLEEAYSLACEHIKEFYG